MRTSFTIAGVVLALAFAVGVVHQGKVEAQSTSKIAHEMNRPARLLRSHAAFHVIFDRLLQRYPNDPDVKLLHEAFHRLQLRSQRQTLLTDSEFFKTI